MNSKNFLNLRPSDSTLERLGLKSPAKRKLKGSIIIPPTQTTDDQFRPKERVVYDPSEPQPNSLYTTPAAPAALPVPSGKTIDLDKVEQVLRGLNTTGDAAEDLEAEIANMTASEVAKSSSKKSASPGRMSAFSLNPVTISVVLALDNMALSTGISKTEMLCHYLSIAWGESRFITHAKNPDPKSSARGQLQFTRDTYFATIGQGEKIVNSLPPWVPAAIASVYVNSRKAGNSWVNRNHNSPGTDASQYLVVLGGMKNLIDSVNTYWTVSRESWTPRVKNLTIDWFYEKYHYLLSPVPPGRQVLMTMCHVEGLYFFSKIAKRNAKRQIIAPDYLRTLHHEDRVKADRAAFVALMATPGLYETFRSRAYASIPGFSQSGQKGDPAIDSMAEVRNNPAAINSRHARRKKINFRMHPAKSGVLGPILDNQHLRAPHSQMPVFAADSGMVIHASKSKHRYGKTIVIKNDDGSAFKYGLLSAIVVAPSQIVSKGQLIGLSGPPGLTRSSVFVRYIPSSEVGRPAVSSSTKPAFLDPKNRHESVINSADHPDTHRLQQYNFQRHPKNPIP